MNSDNASARKRKVAILAPTCLYYQVSIFRQLSQHPKIDLTVYFCSNEAVQASDVEKQFNTRERWGIEDQMLDGYQYKFLRNYSPHPSYLTPLIGLINLGVWRQFKRDRPDVAVLMGWGSITWWLAMLACWWFKIPFLLMADAPIQAELHKNKLKKLLKTVLIARLIFRRAAGFLVSGTANKELYQYYGVPDRKLVPFAYSWGYEDLLSQSEDLRPAKDRLRSELGIPSEKTVGLFCGRLSREKNLFNLLDAYRQVASADKALVMVGDGDLKNSLQDYVASHNLESVFFFGFQNRKDIGKFYAAADYLVLPSSRDTWGLVVNEAMCFGLPVIVSHQAGAVSDMLIHGHNGYQVPPDDSGKMTSKLQQIVDLTAEDRSLMGSRSLEIIKEWSQRDLADQLSNYVDTLPGQDRDVPGGTRCQALMFSHYYLPGYNAGGPIRALANLVDQLGGELDLKLVTTDRDSGDRAPYPQVKVDQWNPVGKAEVLYLSQGRRSFLAVRRLLTNVHCDAIHLTSLFSPVFTIKILLMRRLGLIAKRHTIVAPRGELSSSALGLKSLKKRCYLLVAKPTGLYRDVTWHASSDEEMEDIRREFGSKANVFVAPDIVGEQPLEEPDGMPAPKEAGRINIVFLSRVSRMKNLGGAIDMLRQLDGQVFFNIYGKVDDEKFWDQCQDQIRSLPDNVAVEYHGVVPPEQAVQVIRQHDLFLLPTLGENFGHVIYEALAAGCPVLVSDRTPWRGLERTRAGWDVPLEDITGFQSVLQRCIDMGPEEHRELRRAARDYALRFLQSSPALEANRNLLRQASLADPKSHTVHSGSHRT